MWTQLDARKKIDAIPLRRQKAVAPMMTSAMMAKSAARIEPAKILV
jgi:hypothetical protein